MESNTIIEVSIHHPKINESGGIVLFSKVSDKHELIIPDYQQMLYEKNWHVSGVFFLDPIYDRIPTRRINKFKANVTFSAIDGHVYVGRIEYMRTKKSHDGITIKLSGLSPIKQIS